MCFCAQGNNYRGMVLSEKGRDAVFENEPQPDARHASESTTFKWCACLRWRRLPTLTAACLEALKLAGAEGSELVSLGRCSPVDPPPLPLVRLGCESCDAQVPGAQPCTQIGRFPVGRPGNTFPTMLSDYSVHLHPKDLDAAGKWREAGKGCDVRRASPVWKVLPRPNWADVAAIVYASKAVLPSPLEQHISFTNQPTQQDGRDAPRPQAPSIDPWAGENSSPQWPPFPAPARRGPHPTTPQSHQAAGSGLHFLASLPDDQPKPHRASEPVQHWTLDTHVCGRISTPMR